MNESNPAQLLQQIAQIQRMEPGKLCVIGHGPNGPYYNLQCRENGKPVSRYVPADQPSFQALAASTNLVRSCAKKLCDAEWPWLCKLSY